MTPTHSSENASTERRAGVCMHVASLPGPFGVGEIGAPARAFIDTMRTMQLSVWQFLPLGPTGYGDSPYQSLSTFAGNEMLIGIGDLLEMGLLVESAPRKRREYRLRSTLTAWTRRSCSYRLATAGQPLTN